MTLKNRKQIIYLLLPSLLILFAITIYPFGFGLFNSFHEWLLYKPQLGRVFVGLEQYIRILSNVDFQKALGRTLIYVALGVSGSMFLGLVLYRPWSWFERRLKG